MPPRVAACGRVRPCCAPLQEHGDPEGEHSGLSGTRAGADEERERRIGEDGLALALLQRAERVRQRRCTRRPSHALSGLFV